MTGYFTLFVPGIPVPQGSKSVTRSGRMFEANKKTGPWRATVKAAAEQQIAMTEGWAILDGPLAASMLFSFPRPRSHYGTGRNSDVVKSSAPSRPLGPPDTDKLARNVADAMTTAKVWVDDSRMVDLTASKHYANGDEQPGVFIIIQPAP